MRRLHLVVAWLSAWVPFGTVGLAQAPQPAEPGAAACVAAPATLTAAFAAAQPPVAEARWTLVPWRHSLRLALAEAQRTGKAIYLFVNDGDGESGRC